MELASGAPVPFNRTLLSNMEQTARQKIIWHLGQDYPILDFANLGVMFSGPAVFSVAGVVLSE